MSLHQLVEQVRSRGRGGDTELVHMTRGEVQGLHALARSIYGRNLPVNPETGLHEANWLKKLLPTIVGGAATYFTGSSGLGAAAGALVGGYQNKQDRLGGALMGGIGGYGGGQLVSGLNQVGAEALARETEAAAPFQGYAGGAAEAPVSTPSWGNMQRGIGQLVSNPTVAIGDVATAKKDATGFGGASGLLSAGLKAATPLLAADQGMSADEYQRRVGAGQIKADDYTFKWVTVPSSIPGHPPRLQGVYTKVTPEGHAGGGEVGSSERAYAYLMGLSDLGRLKQDANQGLQWKSAVDAGPPPIKDSSTPADPGPSSTPPVVDIGDVTGGAKNEDHSYQGHETYGNYDNAGGYGPPTYGPPGTSGEMGESGSGHNALQDAIVDYYPDEGTAQTATGMVIDVLTGLPLVGTALNSAINDMKNSDPTNVTGKSATNGADRQSDLAQFEREQQEQFEAENRRLVDQQAARQPEVAVPEVAVPESVAPGGSYEGDVGGSYDYGVGADYDSFAPPSANFGTDFGYGPGFTDSYGGFTGQPTGGGSGKWKNMHISKVAKGGVVPLQSGGFVFPADVVAALGAGSSSAGLEALAKRFGAQPVAGRGHGQSDDVPAMIDGRREARVARDEAVLSAEQVARIGGGDAKKGAKKLYAMMNRVRKNATGSTKQMRPVNVNSVLR